MIDHPGGSARTFTLSDFDFSLPPALIAQHPAPERSASRLLDGRAMQPVDRIFRELPGLLRAGDLLVFNDTRVVKARIFGEKASGGKLELLIERVLPSGQGNEVVALVDCSTEQIPVGQITTLSCFSADDLPATYDTITISEARKPSGSRVSRTSAIAMPRSRPSEFRRWATVSDWSKPRSSLISLGRRGSKASTCFLRASITVKMVVPSFARAVTKSARLPL